MTSDENSGFSRGISRNTSSSSSSSGGCRTAVQTDPGGEGEGYGKERRREGGKHSAACKFDLVELSVAYTCIVSCAKLRLRGSRLVITNSGSANGWGGGGRRGRRSETVERDEKWNDEGEKRTTTCPGDGGGGRAQRCVVAGYNMPRRTRKHGSRAFVRINARDREGTR